MIIKGKSRGALVEMDVYAIGTKCERSLYHAAISPEPPHVLTPEQRAEAIEALETKLGLNGHAYVVVMHEKLGRQHIHVVWSRINLETMRAVSDSHNFRRHEEVARDLERRFGHDRVQGVHHEREGVKRPDRTPSRAELQQQERTGIAGKRVKEEVTAAFRASDCAEAFRAALEERGYLLARGDRRDYVIVDRKGGTHSLARRIDGMKAAELRAFMAAMNPESVSTIEQAREIIAERERRTRELKEAPAEDGYTRGDDDPSQTRTVLADRRRQLAAAKEGVTAPVRADDMMPCAMQGERSEQGEMSDERKSVSTAYLLRATPTSERRITSRTIPDGKAEAPSAGHTRRQ